MTAPRKTGELREKATSFIRAFRNWSFRMRLWLWEARYTWLFLMLCAAVVLVVHALGCTERQVRLTGMLFQLSGVLTIAWGLRHKRKLFYKPHAFAAALNWLKRFPPFRLPAVNASANQITVLPIVCARGRTGPPPGASIEQRVARLESHYDALYDQVGALETSSRRAGRELRETLQTESGARRAADEQLTARLDAAVAGGLQLELLGVVFFLIGILLGTSSPESRRLRCALLVPRMKGHPSVSRAPWRASPPSGQDDGPALERACGGFCGAERSRLEPVNPAYTDARQCSSP